MLYEVIWSLINKFSCYRGIYSLHRFKLIKKCTVRKLVEGRRSGNGRTTRQRKRTPDLNRTIDAILSRVVPRIEAFASKHWTFNLFQKYFLTLKPKLSLETEGWRSTLARASTWGILCSKVKNSSWFNLKDPNVTKNIDCSPRVRNWGAKGAEFKSVIWEYIRY